MRCRTAVRGDDGGVVQAGTRSLPSSPLALALPPLSLARVAGVGVGAVVVVVGVAAATKPGMSGSLSSLSTCT